MKNDITNEINFSIENDIDMTHSQWHGDYNSANVCQFTSRKKRLFRGYKLSYTTGSLSAASSRMQWGVYEFEH